MKNLMLLVVSLALFACGDGDSIDKAKSAEKASSKTTPSSDIEWPLEVVGEITLIKTSHDNAAGAKWAAATIPVNGENVLIEFDAPVLAAGGIDGRFIFPKPVTLVLGKPSDKTGIPTHPVMEIK